MPSSSPTPVPPGRHAAGTTDAATPDGKGYRAFVLAMLVLVYTFNFIDRQILGILAPPIKAELGLTDTELGALGGLAFALFYTALGVPVAWAADRWSRTWIMTIALGAWSGFTALCGLATGFWQLFLCRLGVGIGEAGGVAPAYALVSDYFPRSERSRALGAYSLGIPIGSALGIFLGGWIATRLDWRSAFIGVGLAGLLLVPLFRLTVREPARGGYDKPLPFRGGVGVGRSPELGVAGEAPPPSPPLKGRGELAGAPSLGSVLKLLTSKPSFWLLSFGAACGSITGYGLIFWLPSFFKRSYGFDLGEVSRFYGSIVLIGGVVGVGVGAWIGDRLGGRDRANYARVPAAAFILAIPLYALGLTTTVPSVAFAMFLLPQALSLAWLGPVTAAIQHLVPATMRATASALFLFVNNLIGLGFGTLVFGVMSDAMKAHYGDESLRYAILYGLGFYAVSAALYLLAAPRLRSDWHDG